MDQLAPQDSPTDNIKSYLQNSAIPSEGAVEVSQETTSTSHQQNSSEPDLTSSAFTSSAPDDAVEHSRLSLEDKKVDEVPVIEPSAVIVQAPTSDLRDDLQPSATSESTTDTQKPEQAQPTPNSKLINGSSGGVDTTAEATQSISQHEQGVTPSAPAADRMENSLPSAESVAVNSTEIPHHPPVPTPEGARPELPIDPAPSPAAPAEAPSEASIEKQESIVTHPSSATSPAPTSSSVTATQQPPLDQVMQDVNSSPTKLARPREDDDFENEPAAKRSKTEGEGPVASEFKKPELPDAAINTNTNGAQSQMRGDFANAPTPGQAKAILRLIGNVKRTRDAVSFVAPVDYVALNIPSYPTVIKNPMDLSTLEQKFKEGQYRSIAAFISDFNLIVQNCETFNGLSHAITLSAHKLKASFDKQVEKLPAPDVPEHGHGDKKKRPSMSALDKPAAIRRESRSSLPAITRSPITPASPQTFALNPQGMPLIRRDSAADGRPKREIHPPAPRDLPYSNQKPKKKKYLGELKFCEHVLSELKDRKHQWQAQYFLAPVDPVALNIPDYHKIIKKPMDLGTVEHKLTNGEYENAKEFEADVRLIFTNCYKFNPQDHVVHQAGKTLEGVFDSKMAGKQRWVENNAPLSGPTSPGSSQEASEDEDDDDEEEEDEQSALEIRKLQEQIAAMSKQVELITQKKKSPPAAPKKSHKAVVKPDKKTKKAAPAPQPKVKPTPKSAPKKAARYVSYEEKQDISNRINDLTESKMAQALTLIRNNMPSLKVCPKIYSKISLRFKLRVILDTPLHNISVGECLSSTSAIKDAQGDELELDIDELPNEVLLDLHKFVKKFAPRPEDKAEKASPPAYTPVTSTGPSRKKNKPMGKNEQESKIEHLKSVAAKFENTGTVERSVEYPTAPGMYLPSPVSVLESTHGSLDATTAQDPNTSGDEDDSEESEEE